MLIAAVCLAVVVGIASCGASTDSSQHRIRQRRARCDAFHESHDPA